MDNDIFVYHENTGKKFTCDSHRLIIGQRGWEQSFGKISNHVLQFKINYFKPNFGGVIRDIQGVRFPELKIINLQKTDLSSIEGLRKVDLPVLEEIWFDRNQITRVQELSRCNWPRIRYLCLTDNLITDWDRLFNMCLNNCMEWLAIKTMVRDKQQTNWLAWVVKLQRASKYRITTKYSNTIKETQFVKWIDKQSNNLKLEV